MSYDGPDRRDNVSWRDLNEAVNGLRQELHVSMAEVRDEVSELRTEMSGGFERFDRRLIASSVGIVALLGIAITVAIAIIK